MLGHSETPEQAHRRRESDLEQLRILAWLVQRNRYNREPIQQDGGHRGKARILTITFYAEGSDWIEARNAVAEIMRKRKS